mmetsp:Transcript_22080/g.38177  ORF Transcript_22080/g.38177 Transcript_22080/m.38177 type:complete len:274 (-) Transcript_22080:668-1489(-)
MTTPGPDCCARRRSCVRAPTVAGAAWSPGPMSIPAHILISTSSTATMAVKTIILSTAALPVALRVLVRSTATTAIPNRGTARGTLIKGSTLRTSKPCTLPPRTPRCTARCQCRTTLNRTPCKIRTALRATTLTAKIPRQCSTVSKMASTTATAMRARTTSITARRTCDRETRTPAAPTSPARPPSAPPTRGSTPRAPPKDPLRRTTTSSETTRPASRQTASSHLVGATEKARSTAAPPAFSTPRPQRVARPHRRHRTAPISPAPPRLRQTTRW